MGILLIGLFLILGAVILLLTSDKKILYVLGCMLIIIGTICVCSSFMLNTLFLKTDTIKTDELFTLIVPVNGYYIYEGNYVLQDNARGKKDNLTVAVKDLTLNSKVYLEKRTKYTGNTFFHFSNKVEEVFITFKGE